MKPGTRDPGLATPPLLCAGMEIALGRFLGLEAAVLGECAELAGRAIALRVTAPAWTFFVEFHAGGVRVLPEREAPADVTVAGALPQLLRLGWQAGHGESRLPQGLAVDGDTELLARFSRMLARVGFEPEEFAARFVGAASAHRLGAGLQALFAAGRNTARTLGLDTAEYLREETRDLARGVDVEAWFDQVDALRDAVDRFAARVARLESPPAP